METAATVACVFDGQNKNIWKLNGTINGVKFFESKELERIIPKGMLRNTPYAVVNISHFHNFEGVTLEDTFDVYYTGGILKFLSRISKGDKARISAKIISNTELSRKRIMLAMGVNFKYLSRDKIIERRISDLGDDGGDVPERDDPDGFNPNGEILSIEDEADLVKG